MPDVDRAATPPPAMSAFVPASGPCRQWSREVIYRHQRPGRAPRYGYQLKMGATSLTEAWDARRNASQNHFMLDRSSSGSTRTWRASIATLPGRDSRKSCIKPSPRRRSSMGEGQLSQHPWNDFQQLAARAPEGSRWIAASRPARRPRCLCLLVPSDAVTEGSAPAKQSEGVKFLRQEANRSVFAVESGDYHFSVNY